ncbi:MAG TPA: aminotransferase class III-fold pyridoxal phosphate-dependent enzyme [Campylobacterales bacterium]|nr:aminotransferase class III-fold pyridoxal phosphate-dependent enzyme [Campylobacterales bacterium]
MSLGAIKAYASTPRDKPCSAMGMTETKVSSLPMSKISSALRFPSSRCLIIPLKIFKQELTPLEALEIVKEVRCIGAIGVVELHDDSKGALVQELCVEQGVWIRPFGKLVYSIVAYTISGEELYRITEAMRKSVESIS